ncbi:MAG TPA: hypothetical protein VFL80_10035 [Thermoanaerobaculia bacterium]|nr:hypothetical protein [Thermoanaerobaculia bacterium]
MMRPSRLRELSCLTPLLAAVMLFALPLVAAEAVKVNIPEAARFLSFLTNDQPDLTP